MPNIFMLGHSNYAMEDFIAMLKREKITVLYDIRLMPFSRYVPQFNQPNLQQVLEEEGITYIYKKELGPRVDGDEPIFTKEGFGYAKVLARTRLSAGLDEIVQSHGEHENIAIMATKREPTECHRFLVLAHILKNKGSEVSHILPEETVTNNTCETKLIAMMHRRIKRKTFVQNDSYDETFNAYYAQSEKIAKVGMKKYNTLKKKVKSL